MVYQRVRFPKRRSTKKTINTIVKRAILRAEEQKFVSGDLETLGASVSNAWTESQLCNPAQGESGIQRSGREILIHSLEMKGVLAQGSNESAADDIYNVFRIVVSLCRNNVTNPFSTAAVGMNSPIKKDTGTRNFLVKKFLDQVIPLQVASTEKGGGDGYAPGLRLFKFYKKFKTPIRVVYGDDTQTYPNMMLMVHMLSDSAAVVNPGFTQGYWIARYTDA